MTDVLTSSSPYLMVWYSQPSSSGTSGSSVTPRPCTVDITVFFTVHRLSILA